MSLGTVQQVFRYPVKSMAGESLDDVDLGAGGIPGDRCWAVRDEVRGGIHGGKRIGGLMMLGARFPNAPAESGSSPAEITFPDGSTAQTGDGDINQRLSEAVDHQVTLWPLLPAEAREHYRRGAPLHQDIETELRTLFGRTPDEPLPDVSKFPAELREFSSPPGTYFDAFPLLLLTTASIETMQQRAPGSELDVRRFRPNLLIADANDSAPFPEQGWRSRRLRVGEATVEVTLECPRCVMVTREQEGLSNDPKVMRALVQEAEGNLGVYATVVEPGRVKVGDPVELLD